MVKKASKPHSEERWKQGRVSVRVHEDLRSALEFLAESDHRALSNYVERIFVQHVRERVANPITEFGERDDDDRPWAHIADLVPTPMPRVTGMRGFPPKKR